MARGRIVVNAIASDKRIDALSDDTSRLAFTWLITFADREGRTYGDPAVVRSMLFPRREDVTIARMKGYLSELARAGLVTWYQAGGDWWIAFPAFARHQTGFDKRHEPQSVIPAPSEDGPGIVQAVPEQATDAVQAVPDISQGDDSTLYVQSTAEVKGKEENQDPAKAGARKARQPTIYPQAIEVYRLAMGGRTVPSKATWPMIEAAVTPDRMAQWDTVIRAWVAAAHNPRNITGMLDWLRKGIPQEGNNHGRTQQSNGRGNGGSPQGGAPGGAALPADMLALLRGGRD